MQRTATTAAGLKGKTPLGVLLGETPDISQYLDFAWYDWVWFKENAGLSIPVIGRFLGIADTASNLMSYHILPESGVPIMAGTVQRMTYLERGMEVNKQRMRDYNQKIAVKFKEDRISTDGVKPTEEQWGDLVQEDDEFAEEFNRFCLLYTSPSPRDRG